ncbi:hypothetical protein A7981_07460 [Methylovorus sp. MM2]|uniref:hypothetical protein n=1 Tax=Methylovorus sp. MM2 TaxID=1848038 RepID=UPI0007E06BB8|nr:hypothetical protein [Methylovorus sp. MM2]OAM53224.1 hypothetical protein A7981_07460 [Methylovorus sp. MM2]
MTTSNAIRKTHPMVLVAATSLTIFSLLGSAAITGLIPSGPSTKPQTQVLAQNFAENSIALLDSKNLGNGVNDQSDLCTTCGTIISIKSVEQEADNNEQPSPLYVIQVRMEDGSHRTVTQNKQPQHTVGDQIKLSSNQRINA